LTIEINSLSNENEISRTQLLEKNIILTTIINNEESYKLVEEKIKGINKRLSALEKIKAIF